MNEGDEAISPYAGLAKKIRGGKSASTLEFESRKPEIRIKRILTSGFGGKMRIFSAFQHIVGMHTFSVILNGQHVANLDAEQSVKLDGISGTNTLLITTRVASASVTIELEPGMRTSFACCPKLTGIALTKRD